MKSAALYLRVSTDRQTTENQERELRAVAERMGWRIAEVYRDEGVSGAKSRAQRPAFDRLCKDAARRRFDIVMAWSVDRLGRSLQDLVTFLGDVHGYGVDLFLHQQGVDTTTPSGKALFQMLNVCQGSRANALGRRPRAENPNLGLTNVAEPVRFYSLEVGGPGPSKPLRFPPRTPLARMESASLILETIMVRRSL